MTKSTKNKHNSKKSNSSSAFKLKPEAQKYFIIEFISLAIVAMILWPIFGLVYGLVFTHTEFSYNIHEYVIRPLLFAFFFTLISYIIYVIKIENSK